MENGGNGERMAQISMKSKLILALSAIMLVAVAAISVANYMLSRDAVRRELLTSSLPLTRDNIYSELHKALMEPISLSSLMAHDTFLLDWTLDGEHDSEKARKYLAEVRGKYGFMTSFFVSDKSGNYYCPEGVLKRISRMDLHDVWYYEFVARQVEYDLDVDTSEAENGVMGLFINYKVRGYDGELLGVAGVGLRLDWVAGILRSFEEKYDRRVYLCDLFGLVQVHTDTALVERADIRKMPGIRDISRDVLAIRDAPASFQYEVDGRTVLLSVRYIPEFDWLLLVEQEESLALAPARRSAALTVVTGLAAWMVIILVTAAAVNHYQGRLERMAVTDHLTGAANRREFEARFVHALSRNDRSGSPFSVLLFDLDDFKRVNDVKGHLEGDRVLQAVAAAMRACIRPDDLLARWGGDEFIVLAWGRGREMLPMAERVLEGIQGRAGITSSCGVAEFRPGESLDSLTARVDKGVYRAKAEGGAQVALVED